MRRKWLIPCIALLLLIGLLPLACGISSTDDSDVGGDWRPDLLYKSPVPVMAVFRDGSNRIYTFSVTEDGGSRVESISNSVGLGRLPALSPDGSKIAYSRDDGIWVMDCDGSQPKRLTNGDGDSDTPVWSPDGSKIAYIFWGVDNDTTELYVMNADGSGQIKLSNALTTVRDPSWSPDGSKIAFNNNYGIAIYTVNVDGSNLTRLIYGPKQSMSPAWSPDDSKIAFQSNRDGEWDIYMMNADGSNQTRLTYGGCVGNSDFNWSPDGTKIVFRSDRDGRMEFYVMNADSSNLNRIIDFNLRAPECCIPVWSRDGSRILFRYTAGSNSSGISEPVFYVMDVDGGNLTLFSPGDMKE